MNMFLEIYLAGIYWDLFKTLGEGQKENRLTYDQYLQCSLLDTHVSPTADT